MIDEEKGPGTEPATEQPVGETAAAAEPTTATEEKPTEEEESKA